MRHAPIRLFSEEFHRHRYFYLVVLLLIALMALTLRSDGRGADGKEYLRWSHSLVFDQDLHLLNDYEALGGGYQFTPTGFIFERVNIGAPLMWAPFYGLSFFFLSDPQAPPQTAYPAELVGQLWVNFSSWLYPILAALLTIGALRRFFSSTVLAAALLVVLFGTPVLFYTITFPASSHPAAIFLSALLLYLWLSDDYQSALLYYFTLALVIGWLMAVASYNVVFLVLPGFTILQDFIARRNWRSLLIDGLAVGLGGLIGFAPQMIVWWFLFGNPLYSPYSGQLLWTEPYLLETLFSTFHGLFFYAPVLLLVIPGLWWWRKRNLTVALSIGLAWLLLAYLASINVAWWAGASFGNRYFLTLTPFFTLGLAAFFQYSRRRGLALAGLCVLWTIGLYLQFLNGVGLTSDSIVYSPLELAGGQLTAFSGILSILPQLWANRPWPWVAAATLPVFALMTILAGRLIYGWFIAGETAATRYRTRWLLAGGSLVIVLFFVVAGFRGEQAKAVLAAQGFYDQPHQVIRREVKEVAGKAGLVTRALYHEQTGQPDKAIADLRLASQLWKREEAGAPQRLYLGPPETVSLDGVTPLQLDYPAEARLIGYRLGEATANGVGGELFWQKLPGEKSRAEVKPVVRAFDRSGAFLGSTMLDFPFPAYYVPAGDLFKDTFHINLDHLPDDWVWLDVTLEEDPALPVNAQGETQSGVIAPVPTGSTSAALPAVAEAPPALREVDFPRSYRPVMPQQPLDTLLTDGIKLAGYDLFVVPQSNSVAASVVLYWTAQANVERNYLVSVQLLDGDGQPLIEHSDIPKHATRPTSTWRQGEWILDEHALEIPILAPGSYRLSVSLLEAETGMPVEISPGQTTLTLQDVQIP